MTETKTKIREVFVHISSLLRQPVVTCRKNCVLCDLFWCECDTDTRGTKTKRWL